MIMLLLLCICSRNLTFFFKIIIWCVVCVSIFYRFDIRIRVLVRYRLRAILRVLLICFVRSVGRSDATPSFSILYTLRLSMTVCTMHNRLKCACSIFFFSLSYIVRRCTRTPNITSHFITQILSVVICLIKPSEFQRL